MAFSAKASEARTRPDDPLEFMRVGWPLARQSCPEGEGEAQISPPHMIIQLAFPRIQ
jgi:hypothetical protein